MRYTRGKYLETARQLGMENYRQLFSPDTELGRWLATRNTMLRIGRNLFVHAGLSARLLERDLEMDTLNARMSEGLYRTSKERREDPTPRIPGIRSGRAGLVPRDGSARMKNTIR